MAFFSKKDREPDAAFPQLTSQQGEKMRRFCADAFTKLGRTADGRVYGLETVARAAAPGIVGASFRCL